MDAIKLRFGLAANRLHHETADAALFTWLRTSGAGIRELGMQLHTVGRTHDAIMLEGMNAARRYKGLVRYPYGREGGFMKLVALVNEGRDQEAPFDAIGAPLPERAFGRRCENCRAGVGASMLTRDIF